MFASPHTPCPSLTIHRHKLAEAEVAAVAEGDRASNRLSEAQFEQTPACVGLHETILAAEAMELQ